MPSLMRFPLQRSQASALGLTGVPGPRVTGPVRLVPGLWLILPLSVRAPVTPHHTSPSAPSPEIETKAAETRSYEEEKKSSESFHFMFL
ncbi:unnamed protein product [Boreogadus saida]